MLGFNQLSQQVMRVSKKTILVTLTRFLLFLKQTLVSAHPPIPPISKHFYGNCQERAYIFKRVCIPPPSGLCVPLGVTKYIAKKGLIKDRDKTNDNDSKSVFLSLSVPSIFPFFAKPHLKR